VTTPPNLLRRTATTERLTALARETRVPPAQLLDVRAAARLVDLKGLGAENYNALRRLGIARLEELAEQDPATLLPRWQAEASCRPPTLAQATLWVRAARRASEPARSKLPAP
jgi:hypothetical protein